MDDLTNIDWKTTLKHLVGFATSTLGKDHLQQLSPLESANEALLSLKHIQEAQSLLRTGQRPYMESLDHYPNWFLRLEKNAQLKPVELKDIRLFFLEVQSLSQALHPLKGPWAQRLSGELMNSQEPLSTIDHFMSPNGDIRSDASEKLYQLHQEKKRLGAKIQNTLDELVKGHEHEDALQDKYVTNREGRWVIPVKSGMRHNLDGIIHAASASKQTVFMEPQAIVPLNNKVKQLTLEIDKEIQRLLRQISDYLALKVSEFSTTSQALLEADCNIAKAQFADITAAKPFEFDNQALHISGLKHPLMVLNGESAVPNTIGLTSSERILLLSGPNAGGKTVLLKSLGLAAHMARCGLPLCISEASTLPFFKTIRVAVGDNQSVDESLSTFAGHLKVLDQACQAEGPQSLILIDEICGSTDPDEGAALARGFIHHYTENRTFGLITSHLGPLKVGWDKNSGVVNGSMNYDTKTGRSTYEFIRGVPGKSLAFATAKKSGILESVYNKAKYFLSPAGQQRLQSMEELERIKDEVVDLKAKLEQEIQKNKKQQKEYAEQLELFEQQKADKLEIEVQKSLKIIEADLKKNNLKSIFQSHESRQSSNQSMPKVVKFNQKNENPKYDSPEAFGKAFPPGSLVFAPDLNQDAIVQGHINSKGEIPILSGSMRMMVPWNSLKPPKRAQNPLKKRNRVKNSEAPPTSLNSELDLRGLTVSEAIESLEVHLDKVLLHGHSRTRIIHGHGSEALKKAVRSHLSRSVDIGRWQTGHNSEGGDGVTWAYITNEG